MPEERQSEGVADICDRHMDEVQVLAPIFRHFGGRARCAGPVMTLRVEKGNRSLRERLGTPGRGRVLVVDVGGRYFSVVGGELGSLAVENDWAGVIVNGYIRDTVELSTRPVAIWALGTCPRRGDKTTPGQENVELEFGGVTLTPESYLYADEDGIIVSAEPFSDTSFGA